MKALLLFAGASLAAISPASASRLSIGSSMAQACYEAAEAHRANLETARTCDQALAEEALTRPELAGTHVNRGILSMISGDLDRAENDFDQAIALHPGGPEAWLNKGISQLRRGNGEAAVQLIERAIALRTRKPAVAFYMRGIAHEEIGNVRAAYADLRRASQIDPRWPLPAAELRRYRVRPR